jgi:hypothetical protein
MNIQIKLFDRDKQELNFGDIVAISDGHALKFYAEVQYMEADRAISPFHTFSFHSVKKVDKVPDDAVECDEPRFKCWYAPKPEIDDYGQKIENYLMAWRECERFLEQSMFEVFPVEV